MGITTNDSKEKKYNLFSLGFLLALPADNVCKHTDGILDFVFGKSSF